MFIRNVAFFFLAVAALSSTDTCESKKLSEALGHMIGKNLESLKVPLDMEAVAKGMHDQSNGISSPMEDEDCLITIVKLQKEKNLKEAIAFLDTNRKRDGVVSLQEGKVQFEILKNGEGQLVQSYNSPLVRVKIGNEPDLNEEIIALDEAAPGLKAGIVGMREGEVRKLFIHPKLGYEKDNSLLVIEVEVMEADASSQAHAASNADLPIFQNLDDVHPLKR